MDSIYKYEPLWGSWTVEDFLGEGAFGKVYKVSKEEFGEKYYSAVKILSIPQSADDYKALLGEKMDYASITTYYKSVVSEIIKEIKFMSQFKGTSNIVCFEDHKVIEKDDPLGWDILIRMELLKSLSSKLIEEDLSSEEVVKIGIDICKALELCQKYIVIHRDIKPENIFLSVHGDYKLGDLGIARQAERTLGEMSKKGTYTYMAPEVYKGMEYDLSVDIYSLGITLYKLLNNNRAPFLPPAPAPITLSARDEAMSRRMSGEALPPPCDADERTSNVILKACAYFPQNRFKTPSEMRKELEKLLMPEEDLAKNDNATVFLKSNRTAHINETNNLEKTVFLTFSQADMINESRGAVKVKNEIKEGSALQEDIKLKKNNLVKYISLASVITLFVVAAGLFIFSNMFQKNTDYDDDYDNDDTISSRKESEESVEMLGLSEQRTEASIEQEISDGNATDPVISETTVNETTTTEAVTTTAKADIIPTSLALSESSGRIYWTDSDISISCTSSLYISHRVELSVTPIWDSNQLVFTATVGNDDAFDTNVTVTSSDPNLLSIATSKNGNVTTITVTSKNSLSINSTKNATITVRADGNPDMVKTYEVTVSKNFGYDLISGNMDVIRHYTDGRILAVGDGKTTLTVKSYSGSTASQEITVQEFIPYDTKVNVNFRKEHDTNADIYFIILPKVVPNHN